MYTPLNETAVAEGENSSYAVITITHVLTDSNRLDIEANCCVLNELRSHFAERIDYARRTTENGPDYVLLVCIQHKCDDLKMYSSVFLLSRVCDDALREQFFRFP